MKNDFKGKIIYQPTGKAKEYAVWAANFHVGCSNGCTYCYLKKGIGKAVLGGDKPKLKSGLKDINNAMKIFDKEFYKNLDSLKEHGLFLSFTTDPMLNETIDFTCLAIDRCVRNGVHVYVLTKRTEWVLDFTYMLNMNSDNMEDEELREYCHFGFTLTGYDECEPFACSNEDRIKSMERLLAYRYKTYASIEPIISFDKAKEIIKKAEPYCSEFKIGLLSGGKFKKKDVIEFTEWLKTIDTPIILKQSIKKYL